MCNNTAIATKFLASMAHEEISNMSNNTEINVDKCGNDEKTTQQQLVDAHNEIAELKLQIAWLERSYE